MTRIFIMAVMAACSFPGLTSANQIKTRETGPRALVVDFDSDRPALQAAGDLPGDYVRVTLTGLPVLRSAGRPELPYRTFLVAVPEGSRLELRARAIGTSVAGAGRVAPGLLAESPGFDGAAGAFDSKADLEDYLDAAIYTGRSLYPAVIAEVASTGVLRDQPVAEVRVYPVQFDPASLQVLHHARIQLQLSFVDDLAAPGGAPLRLDPAPASAPQHLRGMESALRGAVINPSMMLRDRAARRSRQAVEDAGLASELSGATEISAGGGVALGGSPGSVKISVRTDGLYQISPADLTAAGVIVSTINPQTFKMTVGGVDMPILVEGEGDGVFSGADRVIFYGTGIKGNRYTLTNVYWLSYGGTAGPRMATDSGTFTGPGTTLSSFLTTVHAEVNLAYTLRNRVGVTEHWYWGLHVNSAPINYSVNTPRVDPAAHTLAVRASMLGLTSNNHTPTLRLNSTQIAQNTFNGQVTFLQAATPASSLLASGNNTMTLSVTGGLDQVASDFFEVDYRRTYVVDGNQLIFDAEGSGTFRVPLSNLGSNDLFLVDVTTAAGAKRVSIPAGQITGSNPFTATFEDIIAGDRTYVISTRSALKAPFSIVEEIPSSLHSAANGADYIVVTDRSLGASVAPLVAHRQAQGLRTVVAFTDDIYDEFSFGLFSPDAIRSFLGYAYTSWTAPAPAFVLLAGDATIDYTDNLASGDPQHVPAILSNFPSFGEAPADNDYAAVVGADVFPEMAVGRLPARDAADMTIMVNNILAYENAPPVAALNQQSLYVADNNDPIFQAILNNLALKMPATMAAATAYLPGGDGDPNFPDPTPLEIANTTAAIVDGFDNGSLVAIYLGHGNVPLWASEKLFEHLPNPPSGQAGRLDLNRLLNSGHQSFLVAMNCINGYWVDFVGAGPGHVDFSLAEEFVRRPNRGAIAAWAPSAVGQLSDYDSISNELFLRIFQDRITTLGPALVTSLVNAVNIYGVTSDNVEGMTLFGDPATRLALDTDADGLVDWRETVLGSNPLDGDSDDDGLSDGTEGVVTHSSPTDSDSDNDGLFDGTERGVTAPVNGTNVSAGQFIADADPATTTDPNDADTDNGGSPDGVEDANHNGRIDSGETNPNNPGDDLACSGPLPEVANVTLTRSGNDVVLAWDSVQSLLPCATYRVYAAANQYPVSSFAPFVVLGDVGAAGFTHVGAGTGTTNYDYLIRVVHPTQGLGPLGHYGQ